ncbi:phage tail tube protein [Muricoccus vinaceus]|uniref:Phage tail tube protein n=1 Tax=Muricoccus vinaceus TaxID=424704 RepID=A0ABV6IL45_9PROT
MSDTTRRIAGGAYATVDGLSLPLVGNPKYRPATVTRESLTGMDSVHGYSEKPQPGMIGFQCRDMLGVGIAAMQDWTNVTVELRLNNGKVVTGTGMWNTAAVEVNSADATFDLTFEGDNVVMEE